MRILSAALTAFMALGLTACGSDADVIKQACMSNKLLIIDKGGPGLLPDNRTNGKCECVGKKFVEDERIDSDMLKVVVAHSRGDMAGYRSAIEALAPSDRRDFDEDGERYASGHFALDDKVPYMIYRCLTSN